MSYVLIQMNKIIVPCEKVGYVELVHIPPSLSDNNNDRYNKTRVYVVENT